MKPRALLTVPTVLILLATSCKPPNDNLIIPGKRVGPLVLGKTKAQDVGVNGSLSDYWYERGIGVGFDSHLKISSIEVTKADFKTKEGLSVGDLESSIISAYGKTEEVSVPIMDGKVQKATLSSKALHYPGIRWLVGKEHKVTMIIVSSE